MKREFSNSDAGAGVAGTLMVIVMVGAITAVLGLALDRSSFMFTGLSADASNSIFYLMIAFSISAFLVFLVAIINMWITDKSDANQGV